MREHNKKEKRFVRYAEGAEMYSMGLSKFQELAKETTVVITTHDEVIASMADCVFAMEDGKLI